MSNPRGPSGELQEVVYKPAGRTIERFHGSSARVRLLLGPFASGKSFACCQEILWRAGEQRKGPDGKRHSRWAVIRATYPSLRDTTIKTFRGLLPHDLGKWNMNPPMTWRLQQPDMDVEVIFMALDDEASSAKLMSLELTGAWINEARDIPKGVFNVLLDRTNRYPSRASGGCTWHGVILDSNPSSDDSWLYRTFANKADRPASYALFKQPSGLSPEAENVQNLNGGRQYYVDMATGKDPDYVKVFCHGEWGHVIEGAPVYYSYRDSVHCSSAPLQPVEGLPLVIGVDWGLTPAACVCQFLPDGRWRVLSEVCMDDAGVVRFAQALTAHVAQIYPGFKVAAVWADPAGTSRAQTDERTNIEVLREHTGWKVKAAPLENNSWSMRLEVVLNALGRMVDGKPGLVISPNCVNLRKGMNGAYHYKILRTSLDGLSHDESPAKNFQSHICEAMQYCLVGGGEGDIVMNKVKRQKRRSGQASDRIEYDLFDPNYGRSGRASGRMTSGRMTAGQGGFPEGFWTK